VKIILTVTGIDHEGIIAAVTATLDEEQQNLIDLQEAMVGVEHEQKVQIRIQAESIFKAMHTI